MLVLAENTKKNVRNSGVASSSLHLNEPIDTVTLFATGATVNCHGNNNLCENKIEYFSWQM